MTHIEKMTVARTKPKGNDASNGRGQTSPNAVANDMTDLYGNVDQVVSSRPVPRVNDWSSGDNSWKGEKGKGKKKGKKNK
mgnify:CR=1 FL=1